MIVFNNQQQLIVKMTFQKINCIDSIVYEIQNIVEYVFLWKLIKTSMDGKCTISVVT